MASISDTRLKVRHRPSLVWHEHWIDVLWWLFVAINGISVSSSGSW